MFHDIIEQLEDFTDEQVGKIFRAMVEYDKNGTIPEFEGELKVAFKFIKLTLDRNKQEYEEKCEMQRKKIQNYWDKQKNTIEYNGIQQNTNEYNGYYKDNKKDKDIDKDNKNSIEKELKEKENGTELGQCPDTNSLSKEKEIFDFWNSQNIIFHKELNDEKIKAIQKALKKYSLGDIKKYIERYAKVINDKNYFFDTKWGLIDFLKQKNAMPDFTDEGSKWLNYINQSNKNGGFKDGRKKLGDGSKYAGL